MGYALVLMAMILIWIAVVVGTYQRLVSMPKWFANPPASFELIRKQSSQAKAFWIPLSALYAICASLSIWFNWGLPDIRDYMIASLACFICTGILSSMYFVREIIAFTKMPADAPYTDDLRKRVKFWLRWTTLRDVLQFLAAIFATIAFTFYY